MATDSNTFTSPSMSAGTFPFGLIARYSGFLCSPVPRLTLCFSYSTPSSSSAQWTRVADVIGW